MSSKNVFKPCDDTDKNSWDICAPIFDHFFIIGPNKNNEISTLYHFPNEKTDQDYATTLLPHDIQLEHLHFKSLRNVLNCFASKNEIIDNLIFYKVEGSSPIFVYACIFKATPVSFPAIIRNNVVDNLLYYRNHFEDIPQFKCGFVFVTTHPFHDLYFDLLRTLVNLECQTRNTLHNLEILRNHKNIPDKVDPINLWPIATSQARLNFLDALYQTSLPCFGESLGFKFNIANFQDFVWKMPTREMIQFSPAAVGYDAFMSWVTAKDYVELIECLLFNYYVIVIGSKYTEITKTISFIPNMIAPFTWSSPIISFVPEERIDLLDSPVPSICGVLMEYWERKRDYLETDDFYVIIDIDNHTFQFPNTGVRMPERQELIDSIEYLFTDDENMPFLFVQSILKLTQDHLNKTITSKMGCALECRLDVENPGTAFHEELFKAQFTGDDLLFIEKLEESQNYQCLKSKLCRINTHIKEGNDASLEGLGEWSASIWKMQHQSKSIEEQDATKLLDPFNPYG